AVAYLHLAQLFGGIDICNRDVTTDRCHIAIDGTKSDISLCNRGGAVLNGTLDEDAAAVHFCGIAGDSAVGEGELEHVEDAAAVYFCGIARDSAVSKREHALVVDAAGAAIRRIARDGAIGERERAPVDDETNCRFAVS